VKRNQGVIRDDEQDGHGTEAIEFRDIPG